MTQRIFLRKTDKAKREENTKLPYFTLVVIPDEDAEGDWKEVGALWPAKTGNGYSGKTADGVEITFEEGKVRGTKSGKRSSDDEEGSED